MEEPSINIEPRNTRLTSRRLPALVGASIMGLMLLVPALAPASVEEQRRRLPPPAKDCDDPVTGLWQGHELLNGRWYKFKLDIHREADDPEKLRGNIESHSWGGGKEQTTPPPCNGFLNDEFILDMPADGSFDGKRIEFIGRSWKLSEAHLRERGDLLPRRFLRRTE